MRNTPNILLSVCIIFIALVQLLISIAVFAYLPIDMSVVLVVLSSITFIIALAAGIALDYSTGLYECKRCGQKFRPTLAAYVFGAHTLTKRYLKCPHCGEKSLCKRRLSE